MVPEGRFSRREVIATATAGALLAPATARAAGAAGTRPGWPTFARAVGALADGVRTVAPGRPFALAGLSWSGPAGARIELRSRCAGGRWGPWGIASVRGHGPDAGGRAGDALYGEPLWLGTSDEVQVRSSEPVRAVRVMFVAPPAASAGPAAAGAAALPLAQPVLPAGPGQPPIIARAAWAGDGARPSAGPYYGAVQLAFVHHTDNPNGYSAADVPGLILSIYEYHRYVRRWFDIGYNFVIDAFGRIWEAREGGIAEPVIGAQAGGYNAASTGVAMLGTFSAVLPPQPAIDALTQLLAWKLSLHGVPTQGEVVVEVDPAAAFYTRFAPGQMVSLPRIAGHRQGDVTDCPGDDLYGALPAIRTRVGAMTPLPPVATIQVSRGSVHPGRRVLVSGILAGSDGTPIGGARVKVQRIDGGGVVTTFERLITAADGSWATFVTPGRSLLVQAVHAQAPAIVSDVVAIALTPALTLSLVSGAPLIVSGTVDPPRRHVTIDVYRLSGTAAKRVLSLAVIVRRGAFTARLTLPAPRRGEYHIVARTSADDRFAAAASPPLAFSRS
jgi:hypothetical protein